MGDQGMRGREGEREQTYWIYDNVPSRIVHQHLGHGFSGFPRSQHANLHGILTDVLDADLYLSRHELWRHVVDIIDGRGVLGGQCRGGCHCVAPMSSDGLLVRLQAAVLTVFQVSAILQAVQCSPTKQDIV